MLLSRRIFFRVFYYMSSPAPGPGISKIDLAMSIIGGIVFAVFIYFLVCLGTTMYARFVSDRGISSSIWYKFPKWVQPASFWKNTFDITPGKYSYTPNTIALSEAAIETMSNVSSVDDCMLACEGSDKDCIGFRYVPTSNTCYLASTLDGIMPDTNSNVMYYVDGGEPSKQYFVTAGKGPAPQTVTISAISIPTATNVATFTTTTHTFKTGNLVTIAGAGAANGSNIITVTDSTHFTIPYKVTADYTSPSGTTVTAGGTVNFIDPIRGTATLVLTTIPPNADVTSPEACGTLCFSNTSCTGFTYGPGIGCNQYTTILTTDMLTATVTANTYLPGAPVLTPYAGAYY